MATSTSLAELHGEILVRRKWGDTVRNVEGALVSDNKGIFDAAKSESPQQGLRSARGGTELEATVEQCRATGVQLKWCHGGAMLADSLTKIGYPARATLELFL